MSEVWENYVSNSFTFSPYSIRKSSGNYDDIFIILSPTSPQFYCFKFYYLHLSNFSFISICERWDALIINCDYGP